MRRSKDVASLLHSLAILSQTCTNATAKYCSEMRAKCEADIRLLEDETKFTKAYFVLASDNMNNESVMQDDQQVEFKSGVENERTKRGYDVPSYEQLAASLVQLDRMNL